jgi:3-methyladenine DNA glycosylase AlkD
MGTADVDRLVADVRATLAGHADPERAPAMQAYMKSAMPFYGVSASAQRSLLRTCFAAHPLPDRVTFESAVRTLWDDATHREERYAAIALARSRAAARWRDVDSLPLDDHLVVTGAWWDYVDVVAVHLVGPVVRADPHHAHPVVLRWSVDDDLWRRRTAILCQVAAKDDTDVGLLSACLEPSLDRREFWLRKAIGWSLRSYAYTDPDWVLGYVRTNRDRLSPLSFREATKHLDVDPASP